MGGSGGGCGGDWREARGSVNRKTGAKRPGTPPPASPILRKCRNNGWGCAIKRGHPERSSVRAKAGRNAVEGPRGMTGDVTGDSTGSLPPRLRPLGCLADSARLRCARLSASAPLRMTRVWKVHPAPKITPSGSVPQNDGSFFQTAPPPNDAGRPHALRSWRWNSAKEPPDSRHIRLAGCPSVFFFCSSPPAAA